MEPLFLRIQEKLNTQSLKYYQNDVKMSIYTIPEGTNNSIVNLEVNLIFSIILYLGTETHIVDSLALGTIPKQIVS